jgi:hypothetical protein
VSSDGPGHSDIFERLFASGDPALINLVAYGLYQRRKRAWITDFHSKTGRFPAAAEREAYSFGYREDALVALRTEAKGAMAAFAEEVIDERSEELRANALDAQIQATLSGIDTQLEELKSPRHHIKGHLYGFLVLVGIVVLGAFILNFEPTVEGGYHWFKQQIERLTGNSVPAALAPSPPKKDP